MFGQYVNCLAFLLQYMCISAQYNPLSVWSFEMDRDNVHCKVSMIKHDVFGCECVCVFVQYLADISVLVDLSSCLVHLRLRIVLTDSMHVGTVVSV